VVHVKDEEQVHGSEAVCVFICKSADYYYPFVRLGGRTQLYVNYTVLVVCAGVGRLRIGKQRLELSRGWYVLLPPGSNVEFEEQLDGDANHLQLYSFSFDLQGIDGELGANNLLPECAFYCDEEALRMPMQDLSAQWLHRYDGIAEAVRFQGTFNLWMAQLLASLHSSKKGKVDLKQPELVLERVLAYIHKHYSHKITREDAILLSGMSTRNFTKQFKHRSGITFNEYVNRIRINKVVESLLLSPSPLSEIAQRVGYTDEFYLSRKFKQATGVSPSAFVKKPKRFASLDHAYTVDMLTLGLMPCAAVTNEWVSAHYDLSRQKEACHQLYWGMTYERRLDLLRAARPDVIIAPTMGIIERDELHGIAPLIEIPWQGISWKQHFAMIAELTGQTEKAKAWMHVFENKLEPLRLELARCMNKQATVALINVRADSLLVYASEYMGAELLYNLLELAPPPFVADMRQKSVMNLPITNDQLPLVDADYMFIAVENNAAARLRFEEMRSVPQWNVMKAVSSRRAYQVDMAKWYGYAPAALDAQLDEVRIYMLGIS
jgi:ABC-type Fe3+-hydroxamate transport system substrate-binding protein